MLCAGLLVRGFGCGGGEPATTTDAGAGYDVLVFSRTAGFRHDAIPAGIAALRELATDDGATVVATEDPGVFVAAELARFEAVVFLNTSGDVLDASQQAAFEAWVGAGGGFVGVHAATDTEYDWPFYGELVGTHFASHPPIQAATIVVEDRTHPATSHLDATWPRTDEWYDFTSNPRGNVHVLASLDGASYAGAATSGDHPIAWCRTYAGGRAFYTGGGHTEASYAEPAFRAHLLGAIRYAAGRVAGDCSVD